MFQCAGGGCETQNIPGYHEENLNEDAMYLVIEPMYFKMRTEKWESKIKECVQDIAENKMDNYTSYFSDMISFIHVESERNIKYTKKWLMPKRIVLGSIEGSNGTLFFRGLVDHHPSILIMDYGYLSINLFWISVCLSMEEAENILPLLWKLIKDNDNGIYNPTAFNNKMEELLACGGRFTSQELFVMIHVAYMYMAGRDIAGNDLNNMVIYWEPHYIERYIMEECAEWLGTEEMPCDIINVVRNICMQRGSAMKFALTVGTDKLSACSMALSSPAVEKKEYKHSNRMVVRFEDLKCSPKETITKICRQWGIPWSDTLLDTTRNGEKSSWNNGEREISGFDLAPVYNTYEKFFSEFDRFRMMLINAPWQRKYGYPYVELAQFSRRELQEMFLKEFRFEGLPRVEKGRGDELGQKLMLQRIIRNRLQKTRMIEEL